ncbi:hypothetical protein [Nostoc sp. LPT]|uniref:hypothetical protein n=1 Tax=Nostoc sp. LPT TaxID=2815387 RepID=UPI001DEFD93C|nr:hypothetical protein [Nostoc sp. LPT]MBN4006540.1 hypothetical protein [Nostoc sp. LPT]
MSNTTLGELHFDKALLPHQRQSSVQVPNAQCNTSQLGIFNLESGFGKRLLGLG